MQTAVDILHSYFPTISEEDLEFERFFLEIGWLNAAELEPGFEEKKEKDRIDKVRRAILSLWREYNDIHLMLRKHEEADIQRRILRLYYDLLGEAPRLTAAEGVGPQLPRKTGALAKITNALESGPQLHHTQRGNNAKIHLVSHARALWRKYKGREAPLKPVASKNTDRRSNNFYEFVADLIQLAGEDWTPDNALRLWRERYTAR